MEVLSYGNKFLDQKATSLRQSLRSGGFVRLQVISGKGDVYQVKINGKAVTVRSETKLTLGDILTARVIKHTDKLELELRHPPSVGERLNLSSSENSGLLNSVIKGLMASRAALDPSVIKRLLNTGGEDKRLLARLAGLYGKKGIDLSEAGWEPLVEFLSGEGSYGGSPFQERQSRREQQSPQEDSPDEEGGDIPWVSGEEANLYHLFNHLGGPEGLTLVLPLKAEKGGQEISGKVIVKFDPLKKMEQALFFLENRQGIWQFSLLRDDRTGNPGYNLSCLPPAGLDRRSLKGSDVFREKLSNLRIVYDDNKVEEPEEDDIPGGVDWIV